MNDTITAIELAEEAGIDPKVFRAALRKRKFQWHIHGHKWLVPRNGPEHEDMRSVLETLTTTNQPR